MDINVKKFLDKALKAVLCKIIELLAAVVSCTGRTHESFMNLVCIVMERKARCFCRYRLYPIETGGDCTRSHIKTDTEAGELAIILQGPVDTKYNFTLETVRLYKKIFPDSIIILSTWDSTSGQLIEEFKREGCEVVINKSFSPSGFCNLNYQLCTSLSGLEKARELGAKYCIKNRSDLRIYKEFGFEFMKSLLEMMPLKLKENDKVSQRGRIISLNGLSGQLFFPYWLQDYLYFGFTEDLINLFDIDYDTRIESGLKAKNGKEFCELVPPEIYITKQYLSKYMKLDDNVESYWDAVRRYFIILDFGDLNVIWKDKYGLYPQDAVMCEYPAGVIIKDPYRNFTFSNFINVYQNRYVHCDYYEKARELLQCPRR